MRPQECFLRGPGSQGFERRFALVGQEQRDGKTLVTVGQRDEHKAAARPDMQGVGVKRETTAGASRNGQFAVSVVENVLADADVRRI